MELTLTLDVALKQLLEPGMRRHLSANDVVAASQVGTGSATPRLWRDPVTGTIMLMPRQLRDDWINSADQVASIIGAADLEFHPDDTANRVIFSERAFGNSDNPYIFHRPVGFTGTPSAPGPPGAAPSIVGAPYGGSLADGLTSIEAEAPVPYVDYTAPDTPTGDVGTGKLIAYTKVPLEMNACLYYRWHHPNPKIGHQTRYIFFQGQLAIEIVGSMVILYTDTSPQGDRSQFQRIWAKPMFGGASDFGPNLYYRWGMYYQPERDAHDRSLMVIPYFRNRVLLLSSNGTAYSVPVKPRPVRGPTEPEGADQPWNITRADTVGVWTLIPAPGRFQIQRVNFDTGPGLLQLQHITLPYTPLAAPTVAAFKDEPSFARIDETVAFPPGYSMRFNVMDDCPPPTTVMGDQSRTYGVTLEFHGTANHHWTPFFYGMTFNAPRVLQDPPTTPHLVLDTGAVTESILSGFVSWGEKPGDSRMEVQILDEDPYTLGGYYYASSIPVRLSTDGTAAFTGLSEPSRVRPLHEVARPRELLLSAVDRWKQLAGTRLRDQATWTGTGHISAVLFVAEQAGIDVSAAETPPLTATWNTPLGGLDSSIPRTEEQAKQVQSFWEPKDDDTAADFILRIADYFSGWDVGFRADGTFYYLPKDWFTTTSLRFFHSAAARTAAGVGFENNPLARSIIEYDPIEPEANVVQVVGAEDKAGNTLRSSLWVDWASIRNPDVVNYLGFWKAAVAEAGGVFTCEELNRIAFTLWEAARRRRVRISFESDFVPTLKLGQIVEVGTYGLYRLKSLKCEFVHDGWAPCTYEGELVETGVGLG